MAEILPNQPIIFEKPDECQLDETAIKLLATDGDVSQFQFKIDPCFSDKTLIEDEELQDSSKWSTTSAAWTVGSGTATKTAGSAGQLFQSAPATNGTYVKLSFIYETSDNSLPLNVSFNGNTEFIYNSGEYEFYLESTTSSFLSFSGQSSLACTITGLRISTVNTDFVVELWDENDTSITTVPTSEMRIADGYATFSVDWSDLAVSYGCYKIAVQDPCTCSQNGIIALDFTTSAVAWDSGSDWTVGGGVAEYSGTGSASALLYNVLCTETEYEFTYTVSGLAGGDSFRPTIGNTNGATVTTDGTYTETLTTASGASSGSRIRFRGQTINPSATFEISDFSIEATNKVYITSNLIKYGSYGCETILVRACNDSDGLGFGFDNTGFSPTFRLPASLARGVYPMTRESYDYSDGVKRNTYGRGRVAREYGVNAPYWVHDFLAMVGVMADHLYFDGVEYFVEEDEYPSVSWAETDNSGGVILQVSKKQQLIENVRLTSSSVGCSAEGSILLDDIREAITDELGAQILTG